MRFSSWSSANSMADIDTTSLRERIRQFPDKPGIYQMFNTQGQVLYVGKAKNLRKRVTSYFRKSGLSPRIQSMMGQVNDIETTLTHTENEALILESNIIKTSHPRYNVLLRDDKSYPFVFMSEHAYPRLNFHRGAKRDKGRYFGPFPSAGAVRDSLNLLQKLFGVRQCRDTFFKNRTRTCLQYQIKRCSGPCVELISPEKYAEDVLHTVMFLEGRSRKVIDDIVVKMDQASEDQDYESAGRYRDQIAALKRLQEKQNIVSDDRADVDVLAAVTERDRACVNVTFIRGGRNLGSKVFFPKMSEVMEPQYVLSDFLAQYYLNKDVPSSIWLNEAINEQEMLEQGLSQQAGHRVRISRPVRGARRRRVQLSEMNARERLQRQLLNQTQVRQQFEGLAEVLELDAVPERIECFDVSHMAGEATVASCVVFGPEGPVKSDYRRYNIKDIRAGDDYAAMAQVLSRRYRKMKEGEGVVPDLVLIDGGKGQLGIAVAALSECQLQGVTLVGMAKGPDRTPGLEKLYRTEQAEPLSLKADSTVLHLLQQIRDEAHRFAITGHRKQRDKSRTKSPLEQIPGIGDKRRRVLLKNLGGLQEVARAGVDDLVQVPGISPDLARRIYDAFH